MKEINYFAISSYLSEIEELVIVDASGMFLTKDTYMEADEQLKQAKRIWLNHIKHQLDKMTVCGLCGSITMDPSSDHPGCFDWDEEF